MKSVGICITMSGATLAVVEPSRSGWRVIAVAEIDWPQADSAASFATVNSVVIGGNPSGLDVGAAARLLRRARRQLKLPNWQAVAVTTAPNDGCDPESPFTAILFAQADLVRCWAIGPDRARSVADGLLAALDTVLDPRLAHASATEAARLAAGAAIAALQPPAEPAPLSGPATDLFPPLDPAAELVPRVDPATELVPGLDPAAELVPRVDPAHELVPPLAPASGFDETAFDATPVLPRIGWAVQRVGDLDCSESGNPIPR